MTAEHRRKNEASLFASPSSILTTTTSQEENDTPSLRSTCNHFDIFSTPIWWALGLVVCEVLPTHCSIAAYISLVTTQFGKNVYAINTLQDTLSSALSFISSIFCGHFSQPDKQGRRCVLLFLAICSTIPMFVGAFTKDAALYYISRVFVAAVGAKTMTGSFVVLSAWITDWVLDVQKVQCFSLIYAAISGSFLVGSLLGGIILRYSQNLDFLMHVGLFLKCFHPFLLLFLPAFPLSSNSKLPSSPSSSSSSSSPVASSSLSRRKPSFVAITKKISQTFPPWEDASNCSRIFTKEEFSESIFESKTGLSLSSEACPPTAISTNSYPWDMACGANLTLGISFFSPQFASQVSSSALDTSFRRQWESPPVETSITDQANAIASLQKENSSIASITSLPVSIFKEKLSSNHALSSPACKSSFPISFLNRKNACLRRVPLSKSRCLQPYCPSNSGKVLPASVPSSSKFSSTFTSLCSQSVSLTCNHSPFLNGRNEKIGRSTNATEGNVYEEDLPLSYQARFCSDSLLSPHNEHIIKFTEENTLDSVFYVFPSDVFVLSYPQCIEGNDGMISLTETMDTDEISEEVVRSPTMPKNYSYLACFSQCVMFSSAAFMGMHSVFSAIRRQFLELKICFSYLLYNFPLLLITACFHASFNAAMQSIVLTYAKAELHFQDYELCFLLATVGFSGLFFQIFLLPVLLKSFSPIGLVLLASLANIFYAGIYVIGKTPTVIFCACIFGSFASLSRGCFPALISKTQNEVIDFKIERNQGLIHGGFNSIRLISKSFGSIFIAAMCHYYQSFPSSLRFPSVGFLFLAISMCICSLLCIAILANTHLPGRKVKCVKI